MPALHAASALDLQFEQTVRPFVMKYCCGWRHASQVPHESTFSRAFAAFARVQLAQHWHATLIEKTQSQRLIGHISRDSSATPARERLPGKLFMKR